MYLLERMAGISTKYLEDSLDEEYRRCKPLLKKALDEVSLDWKQIAKDYFVEQEIEKKVCLVDDVDDEFYLNRLLAKLKDDLLDFEDETHLRTSIDYSYDGGQRQIRIKIKWKLV